MIIDGKLQANLVLAELRKEIATLQRPPFLVIVQVGNNPASTIYINNKLKRAAQIKANAKLLAFADDITEQKLLQVIQELNDDQNVDGFIIQLPLPKHIDSQKVIEAIEPRKDIDGFHPCNIGYLALGIEQGFIPCTPRGCLHLIKTRIPNLYGKNAVVIGRSAIVGRPLSFLLLKENCTVTICHSATNNLVNLTSQADIVITAVGKPNFFGREYFNSNAVVIDVGITPLVDPAGQRYVVGDVHFTEVQSYVQAITPVPGGVGPMTVVYLLTNLLKAYHLNQQAY